MVTPGQNKGEKIINKDQRIKADHRPFSFISLSHNNNQSKSTTNFYNYSKADVVGNVLTLTS